MYIIDTNILSEMRRKAPPVIGWLNEVNPLTMYVSVITFGEIMRGVVLKRKRDPQTAMHLEHWLHNIRYTYADRVLPVTDRVAVEWGRIAALRSRGTADGLIAATAIVHDLIVVTRNVVDFEDTGVTIVNPWDLR